METTSNPKPLATLQSAASNKSQELGLQPKPSNFRLFNYSQTQTMENMKYILYETNKACIMFIFIQQFITAYQLLILVIPKLKEIRIASHLSENIVIMSFCQSEE